MKINEEIFSYIEELSKLRLNEVEKEKAMEDLSNIITFMEQLNQLQTDSLPTMIHPFDYVNALREDEVKTDYNVEDILQNAPERRGTYFKVPKTME